MIGDVDANGIPLAVVRAAMSEPSLRGRVILRSKRRQPLTADGQVVGFVTPRQIGDHWRHGPIFVMPGYRKRGLVRAYYDEHPERVCVAFVARGNEASRRMHIAAGFIDWRRARDGVFMRREATR
jgi:hypothetical protein